MESINNRVALVRSHLDLNQSEFARSLGVTSQLINKIEAGNAKLTESSIRLICFTFKVNEEWLREGKGEMMNAEALLSEREKQLLGLFRRLSPGAQKAFIEYLEKLVALAADNAVLCGEALESLKQAPGGTARPQEAPQGDKPAPTNTEKGEGPGIGPNLKNGETG
jgi:transcriptional regulator with XRE-family HTH domain